MFGFGRKKKARDDGNQSRGPDALHPDGRGRDGGGGGGGNGGPQGTDARQHQRDRMPGGRGAGDYDDGSGGSSEGLGTTYCSADLTSITLDAIPGILSRAAEQRRAHTISEVGRIRDEAGPLVDELMEMGRVLEQDSLDVDSIDKHLAIIVVRGKKQVIDVIRRSVSPLPAVDTIENAAGTESALRQLLKKVGDVLGRQTRVIHIFAKKHANRFKENLAALNAQHDEMRQILDRHNSAESERTEILDAVAAIRARHERRIAHKQKMLDTESKVRNLRTQISDADSTLSGIRSSPGYLRYVGLLADAKKCDEELSQVHNEIRSQFAKISRPLGRYEYGSSLDKEQQRLLSALVSDPACVILPENLAMVSTILSNVNRAVVSGSISVRDVERMTAMISDTTRAAGLLAGRAAKCNERRKELAGEISSARPAELDECERGREKAAGLLVDCESKIASLSAEIAEDGSAIPRMTSDLQIRLRQHTGMRYDVAAPA